MGSEEPPPGSDIPASLLQDLHSVVYPAHLSAASSEPFLAHPRLDGSPSERLDPFETGATTFQDDPFAKDNSGGEGDGEYAVGEEQKSIAAALRARSGSVTRLNPDELQGGMINDHVVPKTVQTPATTTLLPTDTVAVDDSGETAAESGNSSSAEDLVSSSSRGHHHHSSSHHHMDLPPLPPFQRTVSAPTQSTRLGNLRHPSFWGTNHSSGKGASPNAAPSPNGFQSPIGTSSTFSPSTHSTASDLFFDAEDGTTSGTTATSASAPVTPLETLSHELADSIQATIQTLIQLTPPHLFDSAKEQFSACTVQMPSTSLTSLLTAMKSLNYLSENAGRILSLDKPTDRIPVPNLLSEQESLKECSTEDFDIAEMVQSVGDLMGGLTAQAGVDLVLFHGDVGMKHISVNADEGGISYMLAHVIRQILATSRKGDAIEVGLHVTPQSPSSRHVPLPNTFAGIDARRRTTSVDSAQHIESHSSTPKHPENAPLLCSFEILHNIADPPLSSDGKAPTPALNPPLPYLESQLTQRLIKHVSASLSKESDRTSMKRRYEVSLLLDRGATIVEPTALTEEEEANRQPFPNMKLAREPTLQELHTFAETLRGKKATFYANESSVFAKHLTSYLTVWGLDMRHISTETEEEEEDDKIGEIPAGTGSENASDASFPYAPSLTITGLEKMVTSPLATHNPDFPPTFASLPPEAPTSFIIIDDNVAVLRRRLIQLRAAQVPPLNMRTGLTKRPSLAARTKSSPLVRTNQSSNRSNSNSSNVVMIYFTSLERYSQVRDLVQSFFSPGSFLNVPEIVVIPKPVGPRRFLTALHTAVRRPMVDPSFTPIATSPVSPGGGYFGTMRMDERPKRTRPAINGRSVSGSSVNSSSSVKVDATAPAAAAQPLQTPYGGLPALEYFAEEASKLGADASGLIIKSPDGRPMGMFFDPVPRSPNSRRSSNVSVHSAVDRRRSGTVNGSSRPQSPLVTPTSAAPKRSSLPAFSSNPNVASSSKPSSVSSRSRSPPPAKKDRRTTPVQENVPIDSVERPNALRGVEDTKAVPAKKSPKIPASLSDAPVSKKTARKTSSKQKKADQIVVPPINVLIVEDNPINQTILSTFMRKRKIKYDVANNGEEAIQKWRTGGFHLILMDLQLPVKDGVEATREIRLLEKQHNIGIFPSTPTVEFPHTPSPSSEQPPESPFKSSVIIVALTASSLQSDRVSALAAGCNDFLTKPALIDFEGWKRWKGASTKDPAAASRTIGFNSANADSSAREVRSRLHIKPSRLREEREASPGPLKTPIVDVRVQQATPPITDSTPSTPVAITSAQILAGTEDDVLKNRLANLRLDGGIDQPSISHIIHETTAAGLTTSGSPHSQVAAVPVAVPDSTTVTEVNANSSPSSIKTVTSINGDKS